MKDTTSTVKCSLCNSWEAVPSGLADLGHSNNGIALGVAYRCVPVWRHCDGPTSIEGTVSTEATVSDSAKLLVLNLFYSTKRPPYAHTHYFLPDL
jgi:hypothetical protein